MTTKLFDAIRKKCKVVGSFPNMGKSYEKLAPGLRGFTVEVKSVKEIWGLSTDILHHSQ